MTKTEDIANTLAEARDIQSELLRIVDSKKAWDNDDQKNNFHARVNHIQLKTEKHGKANGKDKILKVDFNDLDKLAVAGLTTPSTSTSTTSPTASATSTTIIKKVEPQPIIWLGRGYMGDAND